jgi:rod shape-determining protein MreC
VNKRKTKFILVLLLLLGLGLGLVNYFGLDKSIKNAFFLVSQPVQKFLWSKSLALNDFFETIGKTDDRKKMESKILELQTRLAKLEGLEKENQNLRKALGLGLEKEFWLLLAETLAKDPLADTLLINKGSNDGVKTGMPVITPEKALVGRIEETFPDFSRVMLVSNRQSSFDAEFLNTEGKNVIGIIKGEGALKAVFTLIPQDSQVSAGDQVTTISLGNVFPKGLLVGEISFLEPSDVKPFQSAQLKLAFSLGSIDQLFIVTGTK